MHRWEYGDPAMVLERRGEDCSNCAHLEQTHTAERVIYACWKGGKVGKRCNDWRHEKGNAKA